MASVVKTRKFMQAFNEGIYRQLETIAKQKDVSIQELIRAVIVPDWLSRNRDQAHSER